MTRLFAIEDTALQLDWSALPEGDHTVEVAGQRTVVVGDGGPAAVVVEGLPPGTTLDVVVDGRRALKARTLTPPPGRELCRIASIGDLHIGHRPSFGLLPTIHNHELHACPPERCVQAALDDLVAWGAELLVVKGDITDHGRRQEWLLAAELFAGSGLPTVAIAGNHDVKAGAAGGAPHMEAISVASAFGGIVVHDMPGLRVVAADATIPLRHHGSLAAVAPAVLDAAATANGPVLVALHHQIPPSPVTTHWPPGVPGRDGAASSGRSPRPTRRPS